MGWRIIELIRRQRLLRIIRLYDDLRKCQLLLDVKHNTANTTDLINPKENGIE